MASLHNITHLINSVDKNDIDTIKIENEDTKILINKVKLTQKNYQKNNLLKDKINNRYKNKNEAIKIINKEIKIKSNKLEKDKTEQSTAYSTIISPMVGTFYNSPAPSEPAFVQVNDTVKPKQTVCIIEAMKLMNEIEAEVNGEIVEILVKDGDIIDCGQPLMKVKVV
uniref:Biotin carboxyl carrier protein of acetyl-CoA carboxylase n=1 Tax=Rhodomela confervoides TaxID=35163 RepID=A0A1Z1MA00_RHOCN|nr:acetyl-CoA carboxylase biotin carboxyl carrier protein [Rhodomela confervoides]ARW62722.1 acetyl-CoA carboxylase biotin carboxyl carrier protein [Rhodomela confervoides]